MTTRADALNGKDDVDAGPPWGTLRPGLAARALVALSRNTPLGRGAFRKAMFRAFARLHPGPADVMLWGTRVRLHPGNNVSERKMLMRPDQTDAREHAALVDAMRAPGCRVRRCRRQRWALFAPRRHERGRRRPRFDDRAGPAAYCALCLQLGTSAARGPCSVRRSY